MLSDWVGPRAAEGHITHCVEKSMRIKLMGKRETHIESKDERPYGPRHRKECAHQLSSSCGDEGQRNSFTDLPPMRSTMFIMKILCTDLIWAVFHFLLPKEIGWECISIMLLRKYTRNLSAKEKKGTRSGIRSWKPRKKLVDSPPFTN